MPGRTISLRTSVDCGDADCGAVARLVVDPDARILTHVAVVPRRGAGRLVPARLIAATVPHLRLACTRAELDALAEDQDSELLSGSAQGYANQQSGMFMAVLRDETATGLDLQMNNPNNPPQTRTFDRVPAGHAQLQASDEVSATDGPLGHVAGVAIELGTGRLTELTVQVRHRLRRHHVTVPFDSVEHVGIGVRLALTRRQFEDLGTR